MGCRYNRGKTMNWDLFILRQDRHLYYKGSCDDSSFQTAESLIMPLYDKNNGQKHFAAFLHLSLGRSCLTFLLIAVTINSPSSSLVYIRLL
jgi:hypothetical protein